MEVENVSIPAAASFGWLIVQISAAVLAYTLWKLLGKQPSREGLKRYEDLPGPKELPLLRSLHRVYMGPRPQINKLWTRLALAHGPIYKFRIPGKNFVVVSDPKLVPAILGRPGLPKTSIYQLTRTLFNPYGHDNLFTVLQHNNDEEWKEVRKAFSKSMSMERIRTYFPITLSRTLELCKSLERMGSKSVEAQNAMQRLSLDIIMIAGFGLDTNSVDFQECEILDSLHYCFEEIFRRVTMPWRRLLFWAMPWLPSAKKNKGYHDRLYAAWGRICDTIRAKGPYDQKDPSFLASIGLQTEKSTGKLWCKEKLMAHAAGVVVAGMDTTAHAVSWALFCISAYPGVQERVIAELDEAGLLLTAARPEPRELKQDDLKDLVVLEAVIRESMRMFPVGGSGIGRYADRDVELGGYLIPKGTEVAVCLYTMHNVPWNFPDPDTFKPDRWLTTVEEGGSTAAEACPYDKGGAESPEWSSPGGESGRQLAERAHSGTDAGSSSPADAEVGRQDTGKKRTKLVVNDPHSGDSLTNPYIPFSAGPRDCLGQRMGMMEVRVMLATICGRFRLELAPEMGGVAGVLEKQISSFTLAVDGGLHMHFHHRAQELQATAPAAPGVGLGGAADSGSAKGKAAGQQGSSTRPVFNITATTRRPAQGTAQPFRG